MAGMAQSQRARLHLPLMKRVKLLNAVISQLGVAVDPVSQTIELKAKLLRADKTVIVGMSGTGRFDQPGS